MARRKIAKDYKEKKKTRSSAGKSASTKTGAGKSLSKSTAALPGISEAGLMGSRGKVTGGINSIISTGSSSGKSTAALPGISEAGLAGNLGKVTGEINSIISQTNLPTKLPAGKNSGPAASGFAGPVYPSVSTEGSANRSINGMKPGTAPKPTLSYEQAAETAEELYEEYRKKQKAFEDRYGGLENPELYYGWKKRGDELAELKERYEKMLSYMDRHYMEMEVEPTFTFSGTAADVTPYQQQIGQMLMELEDYVSASKGLPDPNYVRQQQTNIARLQAALDTLPKEAQGEEVLLQVLGGNYYDKVTAGGTAAQIGLGLSGLDLPMDLRDLSYDLTHLRTTPWQQTALDALAILPVVGSLKYADEAVELAQTSRRAGALAESAGAVADTARAGQRLTEAGGVVSRGTEATSGISSAAGLPKEFYLQPQAALDEDWYKQYNAARERYAAAAANSGTAETVTYYRVQTMADGSVPGNRSKESIRVNSDGSISIVSRNRNLDVSAYTDQHYQYYSGPNKRPGSYVVAFEVPRWFDDFVRQEAIIQSHYKTNLLNQGGAAPQMTDLTKDGFKFSLPPIWHEWLEEYATGARIVTGVG